MRRIGLIAGEGEFPLLFAQEAKSRGIEVMTVAFTNHTLGEIENDSKKVRWISLGKLGALIRFFKEEEVHEAVMAGRVPKPDFIRGGMIPDGRFLKVLARTTDHKDRTLLGALIEEMENSGIRLLESSLFLEPFLAKEGILGKHKPDGEQWKEIELGREAAGKLGELDIGQTVVVKNRAVVAVEGLEGTDETIRRAAGIAGEGTVVVKMARPRQDMRFDIPVVGPRTLETLRQAKVSVLAVEAGKTLILRDEFFIGEADRMELAVVGIKK